jgi:hypothetical protein
LKFDPALHAIGHTIDLDGSAPALLTLFVFVGRLADESLLERLTSNARPHGLTLHRVWDKERRQRRRKCLAKEGHDNLKDVPGA